MSLMIHQPKYVALYFLSHNQETPRAGWKNMYTFSLIIMVPYVLSTLIRLYSFPFRS